MNYEINMHMNTIAIIRLFGELDHHETEKIREHISRTILQGNLHTIIWNLERLNFMDSSGIGLILGRMREMRAVNGQTIILNPSNTMKKIFQFSGLASYMMDGSEADAIMHARGIVNG
ncbi:anti-sigma F factor antagonist [Ureibacillus massiliensis 4400831 = CIP 108448 = CCUG 49529]|uniref:Anti-sigma factor antagonist n=1 Tax=Ureibacillus massiliensis 4400831 = CIP 108448 = CCUG 49529 TaxID=1211035 RepID=A0A0A3J0D3_9BACL|nr:anti-sigma factor antagonist [Ureibacillus massiliensis]KGR90396.1 anti-sigma F factor antagonist [Ureibacillus massiliensis 4400831 = CIP 108448 = CCUG 49529]BDH61335.1 anti-sigma F factor antagonist [Lysinibacillus sp. PLM2]